MNDFDEWFNSLRSMYDEGVNGKLILFEESLERCAKKQDAELRTIPEGPELRTILRYL